MKVTIDYSFLYDGSVSLCSQKLTLHGSLNEYTLTMFEYFLPVWFFDESRIAYIISVYDNSNNLRRRYCLHNGHYAKWTEKSGWIALTLEDFQVSDIKYLSVGSLARWLHSKDKDVCHVTTLSKHLLLEI